MNTRSDSDMTENASYYKSVWVTILCHALGYSENDANEWIDAKGFLENDWTFHDEPQQSVMPFVYATLCDITYTGAGYRRFLDAVSDRYETPFSWYSMPRDFDWVAFAAIVRDVARETRRSRNFDCLTCEADEAGIRISIIGGVPVWEPSPFFAHQKAVQRIENSIQPHAGATMFHAADVNTRFADGSHLRPDISIWTSEPEQDTEVKLQPVAVVEIISKDYEAKDLVIGVPFYLRVGIPDVLVFDPETNLVRHWRNGGNEKSYPSPVTLELLCGCSITL